MMPTVTAWEPTLHERESNLARPWVLVRSNCGHEQFFKVKKGKAYIIERFATARQALELSNKLNAALDADNEASIIESFESETED